MKIKEKLFVSFTLLWALLSVSPAANAQEALLYRAIKDTTILNENPQVAEQNLRYSKTILTKDFDFQLTPISEGKFSINFSNHIKDVVSIKVYDIIGNILYEEKVKIRSNYSQQIDLSKLKTNFFIVEIRNDRFNKVKSIVAS